jgi:uncharacterized protein (TIGR02118 family)
MPARRQSVPPKQEKHHMHKVTLLYGHPTSAEDFESYYANTHIPLAQKMKGVSRIELTRFASAPDGGRPAYYRMAELYFSSQGQMQETLGSVEGQAAVADLSKFATGGVTIAIGTVDA